MSGKCAGKRPPPCGRGKNCAGFEKGHRCGAHEPVKGCAGHGKDGARSKGGEGFKQVVIEGVRMWVAL